MAVGAERVARRAFCEHIRAAGYDDIHFEKLRTTT